MTTIQVEILNPKAEKLLQNLAELNLISIKKVGNHSLTEIAGKLRKKAGKNVPSLDEITKELEIVRSRRYAKEKR